MKKCFIKSVFLVLSFLFFTKAETTRAQTFCLRPVIHADLLLLDYPDFVSYFNFGFSAEALLVSESASAAGLEIGWGTLDKKWWDHYSGMDIEINKQSTFRINLFYELAPVDKRIFIQMGGGINISMPYTEVFPTFMLAFGINVFKSETINIPLILRSDCIANGSDVYVPVNLSVGITFKL
jgi:hypothetical protein